jgi:uncharacterized protein YaaN involved in tellurite resistance
MNSEIRSPERASRPRTERGPVEAVLPLARPVERSPAVAARIKVLAADLAAGDIERIHAFGREIGLQASAHADAILSKVRGSELDAIGSKLSEIVTAAQTINVAALSNSRSSLPVIGPLIDRFRLKAGEVVRRFQDVRTQVDALVTEVDAMQAGLAARNEALEDSFRSVRDEHELLEIHMAAGDQALAVLRLRIEAMPELGVDPMRLQERNDLQSAVNALEKRIVDMKMLQHSALQQLPMIRMVQTNNRMLIEKFHTIRELTVPAWKRQFMLALSLNEQKSAVQLADSIDDATNRFLLENARLLKDNTLSTARANQRLVIDVETLRQVHDSLVETMQEVIRINADGVRTRAAISNDLRQMREALAAGHTLPVRTKDAGDGRAALPAPGRSMNEAVTHDAERKRRGR